MRAVWSRFRLSVPGRTPRSAASPGRPPPPAAAGGEEEADRGRAEPSCLRCRLPDRYVKRPPPRGAGAAILDAGVSAGRRALVAILSRRGAGRKGGRPRRGSRAVPAGAWTEPRRPRGRQGAGAGRRGGAAGRAGVGSRLLRPRR